MARTVTEAMMTTMSAKRAPFHSPHCPSRRKEEGADDAEGAGGEADPPQVALVAAPAARGPQPDAVLHAQPHQKGRLLKRSFEWSSRAYLEDGGHRRGQRRGLHLRFASRSICSISNAMTSLEIKQIASVGLQAPIKASNHRISG